MVNNIYTIRDIIALAGGKITGRKKIQKMIYILEQIVGVFDKPHQFRWNYYGVFSEELASELNLGEAFGVLKENEQQEYGYRTYHIEAVYPDSNNPAYPKKDTLPIGLIKYLNAKEPRELEIISSIIYFENQGLNEHEIKERLYTFKSHLENFFEQGFKAYDEIKQATQRDGLR